MKISSLKVMQSAAGWYIGRTYYDVGCGCDLPYSRESGYFKTKDEATYWLYSSN